MCRLFHNELNSPFVFLLFSLVYCDIIKNKNEV
nr:MAG TPA: circumsporozoite-related antigen [Caudoviricetes sp.]